MNFFEHQDVAKKKTKWLTYVYAFTVALIIVSIHAIVTAALLISGPKGPREASRYNDFDFQVTLFGGVLVAVLMVVLLGSWLKRMELRGGGKAIAEWLGGRQIYYESKDPLERKIWNVVEEMSIASGTPVPAVYLLDKESGINAFAAGRSIDDAVIGITRGCATRLSRDELQGVVAHEFSHIIHGDMRLNMRLIGILAGITLISHIGYMVIRGSLGSGSSRRSSSSKKDGGGGAIVLIGLGIYLVGIIGALAAAIIQAAISRQREFLADAAAVQFTRNPEGIGGALKTIGGYTRGSKLESARAGEIRHMFFGQGVRTVFATHPALDVRIGRIEEGWVATPVEGGAQSTGTVSPSIAGVAGFSGTAAASPTASLAPAVAAGSSSAGGTTNVALVSSVGETSNEHVRYANQLISEIPEVLRDAVHECYSARAVVFAILLDEDESARNIQLAILTKEEDATLVSSVKQYYPLLKSLPDQLRVPLLDIAKGALKELTSPQFDAFSQSIEQLVQADDRITLFEWMIQKSLVTHLESHFSPLKPAGPGNMKLKQCRGEVCLLLSTMAHAGHPDEDEAASGFSVAISTMGGEGLELVGRKDCSLSQLQDAMQKLDQLRPEAKQKLIGACVISIAADGVVSQMEAELLRVFAEMLGCPVPPLLPGQSFGV